MSHRRAKRIRACLGSTPIAEYAEQTVRFVLDSHIPGKGHRVTNPIRLTDKCSRKTYQGIKRRNRDDKGTYLPSLKDSHFYTQLSCQ